MTLPYNTQLDNATLDKYQLHKMFLRFLKEKHAYKQFLVNSLNYSKEACYNFQPLYSIQDVKTISSRPNAVSTFLWAETPQGRPFWLKICNEWIGIISIITNQSFIRFVE